MSALRKHSNPGLRLEPSLREAALQRWSSSVSPEQFVAQCLGRVGVRGCAIIDGRSGLLLAKDARDDARLDLSAVGIARALRGPRRELVQELLVGTRRSLHWILPLGGGFILHVVVEREGSNLAQIRGEARALALAWRTDVTDGRLASP